MHPNAKVARQVARRSAPGEALGESRDVVNFVNFTGGPPPVQAA
jgi:hypothetical protein